MGHASERKPVLLMVTRDGKPVPPRIARIIRALQSLPPERAKRIEALVKAEAGQVQP